MVKVPKAVVELVERFRRNADSYRSSTYNEEQLRVEFINPFWKALGWDVDNVHGYARIPEAGPSWAFDDSHGRA